MVNAAFLSLLLSAGRYGLPAGGAVPPRYAGRYGLLLKSTYIQRFSRFLRESKHFLEELVKCIFDLTDQFVFIE
jgi:hypothetical protein